MKRLFAVVAIFALSAAPSFGKTLDFPNDGDVMFKITIPDSWEPDADDDEVVEAQSPDGHIELSIWELETVEDVENLGNDLVEILKDHAKEIKLVGEPKKASPGGMKGVLFSGSALDEEDDHAIEFYALMIIGEEKVAVVYIEADADTPKKDLVKLEAILKSITPPGGKKVLRLTLALDADTEPTTTFAPDAPKIYAFFVGEALKKDDKIKSVWFATDVGDAAPKNTQIAEVAVVATSPTDKGAFSITKSEKDWPVGKYRVEIYVNDELVETLKYKVEE